MKLIHQQIILQSIFKYKPCDKSEIYTRNLNKAKAICANLLFFLVNKFSCLKVKSGHNSDYFSNFEVISVLVLVTFKF